MTVNRVTYAYLFTEVQKSKTKLVTFPHHQTEPKPAPIPMNNLTVKGGPCLKRLLCVKFTLDLNWNSDIRAPAKVAGKWLVHCVVPENI